MPGEEFTEEEKVILGEAEGEPEPREEPEPEEAPEEEEPETEAEPEEPEPEENVPKGRFNEVYGSMKHYERETQSLKEKFDLFKKDPEEYYQKYPDEKPAREEHVDVEVPPPIRDSFSIQTGKYQGYTLADIKEHDPEEYNRLVTEYNDHRTDKIVEARLLEKEKVKAEESEQERLTAEAEQESKQFADDRANELYGKPYEKCSEKEIKDVKDVMDKTLEFMGKTPGRFLMIEDAYFIMNKDKILENAAMKGAEGLINSTKTPVKSISNSRAGDSEPPGFEKYLDYSPGALAEAIDKMSDSEANKFFSKAPESLKNKYPGMPWD